LKASSGATRKHFSAVAENEIAAHVIGTVSSHDKADLVLKFGAQEVINYETHDFAAETMRITNGRGVDLPLPVSGAGRRARDSILGCHCPVMAAAWADLQSIRMFASANSAAGTAARATQMIHCR
jgi:threonine dehydrogenase-like Zn-dependent dehydrogenase